MIDHHGATRTRVVGLLMRQNDLVVPADGISDRTRIETLGLSSFGLVQFVCALEHALGIKVAPDEITASNFATIGALIEFVRFKQREDDAQP